MFDYKNLVATIIPVLLTGFIGYLSWKNRDNKKTFYVQLDSSIERILSPLFHEMRQIEYINSAKEREKSLLRFFNNYSGIDSQIHQMFDYFLLEYYYETEDYFREFLRMRDEGCWEEFWRRYIELKKMVEKRYFKACGIRSTEYQWFIELQSNSIILSSLKIVVKTLYDILKGLLIVYAFLIYFYIFGKLTGELEIGFLDGHKVDIVIIMLLTVALYAILLMINQYEIVRMMNNPKSDLNMFLRKIFPKYFKWWDNFLVNSKKSPKVNYPEMYKDKYL